MAVKGRGEEPERPVSSDLPPAPSFFVDNFLPLDIVRLESGNSN